MKKITSYSLVVLLSAIIVGCGGNEEQGNVTTKEKNSDNDAINATTNIASNVDTKSTNNTNIAQLDKPEKKKKGFDFDSFAEDQKQTAIDPQEERRKAEEKKRNEEKNKRSIAALAKFNFAQEVLKITENISNNEMPSLVKHFEDYNSIAKKTSNLSEIKEWDKKSIKSLNKHLDEINEKLEAFIEMSNGGETWRGDMSYSISGGIGGWLSRTMSPEALDDSNEIKVTPNSYALFLIINEIREGNNGLKGMMVSGKPISGVYFEKNNSKYWEKRKTGKYLNLETKKQRMRGLLQQLAEDFSQQKAEDMMKEATYAEIGIKEFINTLEKALKNDIDFANSKLEGEDQKIRLANKEITDQMAEMKAKRKSTLQKLKSFITKIKEDDSNNISGSLNIQFVENVKKASSPVLKKNMTSSQILDLIQKEIKKINENNTFNINYFNFRASFNDGDKNYTKDVEDTIYTVLNIDSDTNEINLAIDKLSKFNFKGDSDAIKFKNLILDYIVLEFAKSNDLLLSANSKAYTIASEIYNTFNEIKLRSNYGYHFDSPESWDDGKPDLYYINAMNNLDKNNPPKKFSDIIKSEKLVSLLDYMHFFKRANRTHFNFTSNILGLGNTLEGKFLAAIVREARTEEIVKSGDIAYFPTFVESTLRELIIKSRIYSEFQNKDKTNIFYSFFGDVWIDDRNDILKIIYYLEQESGLQVDFISQPGPDGEYINGISFPNDSSHPGVSSRLSYNTYLQVIKSLIKTKNGLSEKATTLNSELANHKTQLSEAILDDQIEDIEKNISATENQINANNELITQLNFKIKVNVELCMEALDFPVNTAYYWKRKQKKIDSLTALTTVHKRTKDDRETSYIRDRITKIITTLN